MASKFPKHLLNIYAPSIPHEANQQGDDTEASPLFAKDNRIRAENKHYKDLESYICSIGLLRCVFNMITPSKPDGFNFTITGTAVILYTGSNDLTLLTCAHNMIKRNRYKSKWVKPEKIAFELRQNIKSYYIKKDSVANKRFSVNAEDIWVHPKYKTSPNSNSGYDIAILKCSILEDHVEIPAQIKTVNDLERLMGKMNQYNQNRKMGCLYDEYDQKEEEQRSETIACIVGYPYEKKGQLYGMKEKVCTPEENNAVLFYDKLITSGGQSGSPILQLDHINDGLYSNGKTIVGIHTGGDAGHGNWGTKITEDIKSWIDEGVKKNRVNEEPKISASDNCNYEVKYGGDKWNVDIEAIEKHLNTLSPADYSKAFPKLINAITLLRRTQQQN
eukprot:12116_1